MAINMRKCSLKVYTLSKTFILVSFIDACPIFLYEDYKGLLALFLRSSAKIWQGIWDLWFLKPQLVAGSTLCQSVP